jgi:hypothetical protein
MLVSLLIEDTLTNSGCIIVGPYDRVPAALEAARTLALDAAILDVTLLGQRFTLLPRCYRVAASRFCFCRDMDQMPRRPSIRHGQSAVSHSRPSNSSRCSPSRSPPQQLDLPSCPAGHLHLARVLGEFFEVFGVIDGFRPGSDTSRLLLASRDGAAMGIVLMLLLVATSGRAALPPAKEPI